MFLQGYNMAWKCAAAPVGKAPTTTITRRGVACQGQVPVETRRITWSGMAFTSPRLPTVRSRMDGSAGHTVAQLFCTELGYFHVRNKLILLYHSICCYIWQGILWKIMLGSREMEWKYGSHWWFESHYMITHVCIFEHCQCIFTPKFNTFPLMLPNALSKKRRKSCPQLPAKKECKTPGGPSRKGEPALLSDLYGPIL